MRQLSDVCYEWLRKTKETEWTADILGEIRTLRLAYKSRRVFPISEIAT